MKNIIKIFVYTGSCNKHSTTAILAERLVKTIQETTKLRVSADYFSGSNAHIEECVGCTQCFMKGKCTLDVRDDLPVLRKKMMEADCIILGSPVYFHSVSGNMKKYRFFPKKTFLPLQRRDRLSFIQSPSKPSPTR